MRIGLVIGLLSILHLYGQTYKQYLFYGDQYMQRHDYYGATIHYERAWKIDSSDISLAMKIADAAREYQDYLKARFFYEKVYMMDKGERYPMAVYYLAQMYKHVGQYKEAKKYFKKSLRYFRNDKKGYFYQKIIQEQVACDSSLKYLSDSLSLPIKHPEAGLNTWDAEWSPFAYSSDTWWISALSADSISNEGIVITDDYSARHYIIERKGNEFARKEKLWLTGQKKVHESNLCMSPLKDRVYFSVCDTSNTCRLWWALWQDGKIIRPQPFPEKINQVGSSATQPFAVLVGGMEVIFYAATYPQGKGQYDIWYCFRYENGFSDPYPVGDSVNSPGSEITPFYDPVRQYLYFSSDWHTGMGGFDVFYARGNMEDGFSKPHNMLPPINSPAHDMYYKIFDTLAVWVSNRPGSLSAKGKTCCNDVYYFSIARKKEPEKNEIISIQRYLPLKLYFHNDEPNPRSWDTTTMYDYPATCLAYLLMRDEYSKHNSKGIADEEQREDAVFEIEDFFDNEVKKGLDNLYKVMPLLARALNEGKTIRLTIKGFASPLAKSDYNVNLTLRRIASLVNYLRSYNGGELLPYLDGYAQNGARLIIKKIPFGEYEADKGVSDDLQNIRQSVYSRKAAIERRIEILAVEDVSADSVIRASAGDVMMVGDLIIPDTVYFSSFSDTLKIRIRNIGQGIGKIYEIKSMTPSILLEWTCDCNYIPPGIEIFYSLKLKTSDETLTEGLLRIYGNDGKSHIINIIRRREK